MLWKHWLWSWKLILTLKERLCVPSTLIFCCVQCVVLCLVNTVCCIVLCLPWALISGKRQHGSKGRNDLSAESQNMWNLVPSTENQRKGVFHRKHWVRPWERWEVRLEPSTKHWNIHRHTIDSWASEYIKPKDCVIIHLEPTVQKVNTLRRRRNRTACDNRATPRCAPVNDQSPGPATGTLPGEPFEMSFCSHKNQWLDYDPWSNVWWYFDIF